MITKHCLLRSPDVPVPVRNSTTPGMDLLLTKQICSCTAYSIESVYGWYSILEIDIRKFFNGSVMAVVHKVCAQNFKAKSTY